MSKVKVKLFAGFGEAAQKSSDEVAPPADGTVYSLLTELAGAYGERFRDELFGGSGRIRDDVTIAVNSVIIDREKAGEKKLKPGDVVALLPIFPGGG